MTVLLAQDSLMSPPVPRSQLHTLQPCCPLGMQDCCEHLEHKFFFASETLGQLSASTSHCLHQQPLTLWVHYSDRSIPISLSAHSRTDTAPRGDTAPPGAALAGEYLRHLVPGAVGTALFRSAPADPAGTAQAPRTWNWTCQPILQ